MSAANEMDPGAVPDYLPELSQLEEMLIARSHVQMMIFRYRGHQYRFSGHCVSFMQNTVRTVSVLPNLLTELNMVLVRPADTGNEAYERQFRADFRVQKDHVLAWLRYLREHHPDYRHVTLSIDRVEALPADGDVSDSLATIDAPAGDSDAVDPPEPIADPLADPTDRLPPVNAYSMVPSLGVTETEANLIREQLQIPLQHPTIPAPEIQLTPLDESSGKEHIFAMAFPTLYPTGQADFNIPRLRKVTLAEYAQHFLRYKDQRFGRHPRWRFLIFNMIMRRKAAEAARFYVSKASGFKDMSRDELATALQADERLVDHVVRQGAQLTGTRPFWRRKSNSLTAQARFLSHEMAPVFVTFSAADMQWQDLHRHLPGWADVESATDAVRRKLIWQGIQEYPHLAAHYLQIRLQVFFDTVLKPYLGYTDYWHRFEWQARGSGHLHCLFWIPAAPGLDQDTDAAARATFAGYWGNYITAWNPDATRLPDARHPSSIPFADLTNTADQFTALVNRLQRHTKCTRAYCLRAGEEGSCRFFFPRPEFEEPVVTKAINRKSWLFSPARNDPLLNQCAPVMTMGMFPSTCIT